jgi:hypothetical protein
VPYKSDKQRRFMHAQHPGIAAKWDSEIRGKKKVSKSKRDWAIGLGTATVGGALANQVPAARFRRKKDKDKSKGKVKKAYYTPTSTDPYFNHRAAEAAFNLVMKMDMPTAEMFTTIVVSDLFEDDINNNLETIQKSLNQVFAKRAEQLERALVRAALNSPVDQLETFAKAHAVLEEISKETDPSHTPQFYGYDWDPADFRRDPATGRFMVKVKHTMTHPLSGKQEETIIGTTAPAHLNREQRARYQDEYRQVASFLGGVKGISGQTGDVDVIYHLRDRAGNNFTHLAPSGDLKPPTTFLDDPNFSLVAMEAKPKTLTAGGAAYGLLGGMSPEAIERTNNIFKPQTQHGDAWATTLATKWSDAGTTPEGTGRLFGRLNAGGTFLNQAAPPGSKAQLAGKFAQVVGQYGPEAEKVIGPSARKTAYRYRGTEKAPDEALISVYGREIQDAKKYGITEPEADKRLMARDGKPGFGTLREQNRGDFTSMGSRRPTGAREVREQGYTPSIHQMSQDRAGEAQMMMREPSWAERGAGTAIVADYLHRRLPDKHLYKLHVSAGNTPPSEGVIINSEGQLAVQAVGYGDDHYLPFNLKHLGALKGGEYIRNRSVGGLTSEDVYTGLITGARRVTVVSRSGTFSMEFEPDFRGGRRHNDKAKRMTARYEALLDAVQSGQVDRQQVPKAWKEEIKQEVLSDEYFRNARKEVQQDEIEARLKEFKEHPKIEGRDEERAEHMAQAFEERAARGEVSTQDAKDYRTQVFNELYNMKEVRFRLNGIGYEAALKSLQEQFPYYIKKVETKPQRDEELLEFTLDDGYVEPGRNRPTAANAGYYGTKENKGQKFLSASQVDYQRGKKQKTKTGEGTAAAPETTPEGTEGAGGAGTPDEEARRRQQRNDTLAREGSIREAVEHAVRLRADIRLGVPDRNYVGGQQPGFMSMDDDRFRVWMKEDSANIDKFNRFLEDNAGVWSQNGAGGIGGFADKYERYKNAAGQATSNPYHRDKATNFPAVPYSFTGEGEGEDERAYHAKARPAEISAALRKLDRSTNLLTSRKQLSELTDDEMRTEIGRLDSLRRLKTQGQSTDELLTTNRDFSPDAPSPRQLESIFESDESMAKHLDKIHQSRYLRSMEKLANVPPPAQPGRGGPTTPTPGTGPTTPPAAPPTPAPGPTGPTTPPTGPTSVPVVNPPGGPGGPARATNAQVRGRIKPVDTTPLHEKLGKEKSQAMEAGAKANTYQKLRLARHEEAKRNGSGTLTPNAARRMQEESSQADRIAHLLHTMPAETTRQEIFDLITSKTPNEDLRRGVLRIYDLRDLSPTPLAGPQLNSSP